MFLIHGLSWLCIARVLALLGHVERAGTAPTMMGSLRVPDGSAPQTARPAAKPGREPVAEITSSTRVLIYDAV